MVGLGRGVSDITLGLVPIYTRLSARFLTQLLRELRGENLVYKWDYEVDSALSALFRCV